MRRIEIEVKQHADKKNVNQCHSSLQEIRLTYCCTEFIPFGIIEFFAWLSLKQQTKNGGMGMANEEWGTGNL